MDAPLSLDEDSRIAALRLLNILDTEPEERFDRLTRLAKRLFAVPIAQVTLIDSERQWFKSSCGAPYGETPRNISFCAHAILGDEVLLIPDATADVRFHDNPLVLGEPNIRFYAGCPLKVGAHSLGTLCLIDDKPRQFSTEEHQLLRDLAALAEQELTAIQLATTDHLTTISNLRGFEALARHALAVCRRTETSATLLYFDLDKFKLINDAHGHAEGDRALKVFSHGLLTIFRESDVLGRLGGDEFAILLMGAVGEAVEHALDRLREWLESHNPSSEKGYTIQFNVGQVAFDPASPEPIEFLLAKADAEMYERKKASRPFA